MSWFLDLLAVFFILIVGVSGFKNGIIEELGRLIGLTVALIITINFTPSLSEKIYNITKLDQSLCFPISFTLIFSIFLLISRLLTKMVHIAFLSRSNQWANRSLGFLFGTIKGAFIIITFIWFLSVLPLKNWNAIIVKNSTIAQKCNLLRMSLINFFNLEDSIVETESYIIELTQP
tara:strand:- start:498 stop:1025 length:528 start_codon:yes stop_codon:yes gene_type:complete